MAANWPYINTELALRQGVGPFAAELPKRSRPPVAVASRSLTGTTHKVALLPMIALTVAMVVGCQNPQPVQDETLVGRPIETAAQRANLWYRIALDDTHLKLAIRLHAPPSRTKFFLPGEWAGRSDFAQVIGITGASTSRGPAEFVLDRRSGALDVASEDADWVQLEYRVALSARSEFHAQLDGGVLLAFGPTFLVTPAKQILDRTSHIPIELNVPSHYEVVATWPDHGRSVSRVDPSRAVHQFIASDVGALRDAFIVAGPTLRPVRTGSGGELVEVAFAPAFEGDTAEFAELVSSIADRFRARFGNSGAIHVFVRTRASTPGEFGGVGRRGGFILDVPPDTQVSNATRLLVAHEALHVWNGHLLIPSPAVEATTRWFKEGVTHYIALKSLPELDEQFVLTELAQIGANYSLNPLSRGEEGRAIDAARLPYDFGVLVALALDAALIRSSGGELDVTCWLEKLLERDSHHYDEQILLESLQQCAGSVGGREIAQLWRRMIRVREPIDLRTFFADVGLHWLAPTAERPARLVPLDGERDIYRRLFNLEEPP